MRGRLRSNLVAIILDDRIAQQVAADLVEAGPEIRRVRAVDLRLDQFPDQVLLKVPKTQALQSVPHRRTP